ncbi:CPBP family glutamic-type intramembrane protease [Leptolyngbya iicbica]|uniref:CPBP family intramembrane metalloprotease domain-containing protein n=2 Tax=Cyanophyceae TaxID=3028117 RepID=A0A4Q7E3K0_9CYAN|nr:CPBP family glutamic-type intramembrane protease [Leptolyngbya sp. LK]RZM76582.1 CPBP family intramembrane metalloprotease domain-containing protein [Leptolyngbya sp. LK]
MAVWSCCLVGLTQLTPTTAQTGLVTPTVPPSYPAQQFPKADYLPVSAWSGRLVLPNQTDAEAEAMDWVWLEIYTSPDPVLVGQWMRLQWQDSPEIQAYLQTVTRGIEFNEAAIASLELGRIHPTRLNGWANVGPLQSLAGTRPEDDMIVALPEDRLEVDVANAVLRIAAIPIQIPERFYSLVTVLGPNEAYPPATDCPSRQPCPPEYQQVRHYNPVTQAFDGAVETVYWPQAAAGENGVHPSTSQWIARSPAGAAGWYIYGAQQSDGLFGVKAISPNSLFQLTPQRLVTGRTEALNYINFGNWRQTPQRKGTAQSVFATPNVPTALPNWQMGDRFLVIHLFGGIGGNQAEPRSVVGTVTGHYAYGFGEVVLDPFTQTPRLQIIYDQVYSHNPQGIVAGRSLWAEYAGNLQRGWLGTRPISDVLVKIPSLSHVYRFGETTLNPFATFQRELAVMMARYRTGDGSGAAIVTPAQSCVQDSNQALYETIQAIKSQVTAQPEIGIWLKTHPDDPQTALFQDLIALGQSLQRELVPLGIARPDWQDNAQVLVGIAASDRPARNVNTPLNNLLSWRTVMPRVAYDNVTAILLNHGAELWFLRTNQVGGADPTIRPLAPTELLGEYTVIPTAFSRVIESLRWPRWRDWGVVLLGLAIFAAMQVLDLRLPADAMSRLIREGHPGFSLQFASLGLLTPALVQELLFRVLLLPHPTEAVRLVTGLIWSGMSLGLFVAYCSWRSRRRHQTTPHGALAFDLYPCLCLGILAMVIYFSTGSLWAVTVFHWGAWLWQQQLATLAQPPVADG